MLKYILAHWRGQQNVLLTCLLNGIFIPFLAPITAVIFALIICLSVLPPELYHEYETKPVIMLIVYALLAMLMICEIWAAVGVFRCGLRYTLDRTKGYFRKAGTIVVALLALILSVATIKDVTLFSIKFSPDRVSHLVDSFESQKKQQTRANQDAQILYDELEKQKRLRHDE